ncbi:MAG: MarP family serine protease [Actinomycetota bacterium]|nr:MarP family serine protease [Actinomycetota bacterium]
MTAIDWIILAFVSLVAVYGFAQGFLVGALSLAGFIGGGFAGSRLGPLLLSQGSSSRYAPLFALGGAVLLGGLVASTLEFLGWSVRRRIRVPALGAADGLLGAALMGAVGLGLAWIIGAVALQTPGAASLRGDIQRSVVLQRLNQWLPPSGSLLNALARFDPFPRINGPRADVPPPTGAILRDPDVRAASSSVVRVLGTACGLALEGSGWIAAPGIVVTNAHVVAGEDDTTVQYRGRGNRLEATSIHFDPRDDIAVLRIPGLGGRGLPVAKDPASGTPAAVLGFPEDGPFDARSARLGSTENAITHDAYGNGPIQRSITSLRGLVREGNSGGPMIDGRGEVVTTVFAATVGGPEPGGYGVPNATVRRALADARRPVDTGPCAR